MGVHVFWFGDLVGVVGWTAGSDLVGHVVAGGDLFGDGV